MKRTIPFQPKKQKGAVLFVALVILLLVMLLAVASSQGTLLQEKMSGNFRAQQVAFERAEGKMAEGRDHASDPLWAYDHISDVPVGLGDSDNMPWDIWKEVSPPEQHFDQQVRACGGACPERRGSILGDDPNKKPRFYIISGQEKDPGSDPEHASWASIQTIYVF